MKGMQDQQSKAGSSYFLSDLHLFSRRSSADRIAGQLQSAVKQAHTLILGGDIFDFRWSSQGSLPRTIADAHNWLADLVRLNAGCRFHYLLGNHDCHPEFLVKLNQLSRLHRNFVWHPHYLRIEQSIFLHGDVVDTRVRHDQNFHHVLDAKRLAGEMRQPPTPLSHFLYDAAIQARLHRLVVHLAKPHEMVFRRLQHYLHTQQLSCQSGVANVFFGHTHRCVHAMDYGGMRFFNPGATIKGLPFQFLEAQVPALPLDPWKDQPISSPA